MTTKEEIEAAIASVREDLINTAKEWIADDPSWGEDVHALARGEVGTSFVDVALAAMNSAWDSPSFLDAIGVDNDGYDHASPTTQGWQELALVGITPDVVHKHGFDFERWDS